MEDNQVIGIEGKLAGMLRPVKPRREFINGLGGRIQSLRHTLAQNRSNTRWFLVLLLVGMVSAGLIVSLAARGLSHLMGARR